MKITNIGGATAVVQFDNKKILFDPWLTETVMEGSWFHWPKIKNDISDLGHIDYLYISHIHEDHYSLESIKKLKTNDIELIVMDRSPEIPNFILKSLETNRISFKKIHLVRPYEPIQINNEIIVDMVTASPENEYNYLVDSGLILKHGNKTLYNANDCSPYPESLNYIKNKYGIIDLALIPYSGGSGYPGCYLNLTHDEKLQEKNRIFNARIKLFIDTVEMLDPIRVMPFADQFVLGGNRSNLNQYIPHEPSPGYVKNYIKNKSLRDKILLLKSGQSFDMVNFEIIPNEPYYLHSEKERSDYIAEISDRRYDFELIQFKDTVPVRRLLELARKRMFEIQNRRNIKFDFNYYINIKNSEKVFHFNLNNEDINEIDSNHKKVKPYLSINIDYNLLILLLINSISWNMADHFIDYERVPNIYNEKVYIILNSLTI